MKRTCCFSSYVNMHKIALGKLVFQMQFMCNIHASQIVMCAFYTKKCKMRKLEVYFFNKEILRSILLQKLFDSYMPCR